MDAVQRRWIVVNAVVITAAINTVLNALPAVLATRGAEHVPLWTVPFVGGTGVYTDTLGTLLILPFVTTVVCTTAVRRARRDGALAPLGRVPVPLGALPPTRVLRAAVLAFLTVALFAAPAAGALALAAPDGLDRDAFVAYKTVLGVGLGLVVTPVIAMRALADPA